MVSNIPNRLGKLENVPIREVWKNEESVFTPWLMENIEVINELINVDIEGLERESNVGSYTADLIGKVAGTDNYVVIENQFGMSNHDHLGKLLTYISGKEAYFILGRINFSQNRVKFYFSFRGAIICW